MAAKKTTTKKATAPKNATAKKGTAKKATAKKAAAKKTPAKATKADAEPKAAAAKPPRKPKADGKMSALDAAAKVLGEAGEPMNAKGMIDAMAEKKYWTSPGGKTPHATLYAAILREINAKGKDARFEKTDRGLFQIANTK
ncbi:MAG: winged helix-turn-helix domain-containing protein [Planctomycetales bacterium]